MSSKAEAEVNNGLSKGSEMRGGKFSQRLKLLLWKNLLLRKTHYLVTTSEILLPAVIALLIALLRTQIVDENKVVYTKDTIYGITPEEDIIHSTRKLFKKRPYLGYVPSNNLTDSIMEEMSTKISARKLELRQFKSEEELDSYVDESELESARTTVPQVAAAIIFGSSFQSENSKDLIDSGEERFSYKIRLPVYTIDTSRVTDYIQFPGPNDDHGYAYINSGFTGLQILMDKILIKMLTNTTVSQEFGQEIFPYPPYVKTKGFDQLGPVGLPFGIILGFIFIVPSIIVKVGSERETGIKELMKIMGLPNWIHWLGWMLNSLLVLIFSITIITFLFYYNFNEVTGPVIVSTNPTVWWFILFLYVISATAFCFFVSVWFDKPTTATALGVVVWLVGYLITAILMEKNIESVTTAKKLASSLFPNMALHWAIKAMYSLETRGVGARWSNFFTPISSKDLSLFYIMCMFIIDTIIYVCLTIYLENVLPSKYGIRKPWNYIFKSKTWISKDTKNIIQGRRDSVNIPIDRPGFEKEPVGLTPGVSVKNLHKVFGSKKAVDGISIKMYHGQITALVGHNGAGKTTTLSMLTGLLPPTSGAAVVNGYDMQSEMDKVRESLGLCPQHNMLFDKLTVHEHLIFFGGLKGLNCKEAASEAKMLIEKLELKEKRNFQSCQLSGGQKRKLSLGIALIGGSKIVILDECTSGMDPEARRVIWDLLLELREERTIILTTHFMEEADILGDRIAIMSSGKIKCCGTPLFLKKHYGAGYTLKMTTIMNGKGNKEIANLIQSEIPEAVISSVENTTNGSDDENGRNQNSEISASIPSDEETVSKFPKLFSKLNNNKEPLGIITIGLGLTTMDQVFLKIGEIEAKLNKEKNPDDIMLSSEEMTNVKRDEVKRPQRTLVQQIIGLFEKKWFYTLRNKKLLLAQFVAPSFLLTCAILLSTRISSPDETSQSLKLNVSQFDNPVTFYTSQDNELGNYYKEVVGPSAVKLDSNKTNVITELLKISKYDLGVYRDQYMIAAELNSSHINAMYSSIPFHSSPISLNLVTNAILKSLSPSGKKLSIEVAFHPLQNQLFAVLQAAQPNPTFSLVIPLIFGILIPIGLALFAASYVIFPTDERLSKSKQLQLMTGVSPFTFWGTSFIWDFFVMVVAIGVMAICFLLWETNGAFSAYGGFGSILLILVLYGYSSISFSYLVSLFASSSAVGFAVVTILHVLFGMIFPIVVFAVEGADLLYIGLIMRYIFRPFASFGATMSIMQYAAISTANSRCSILSEKEKDIICNEKYPVNYQLRQCCDNCEAFANVPSERKDTESPCFEPEEFFTWNYNYTSVADSEQRTKPGIGQEVLWVVIMALVYQLVIALIESGFLKRMCNCLSSATKDRDEEREEDDEDVANEVERVHKMTKSEDALVVCGLSKRFGRFKAVRDLNFGVHYGECFGLLGVNGAGKTTTFKMLTGDESLTNGNAYCLMNTLISSRTEFLGNIGYCPQFDAIIDALTGREMLRLFCHLRGVPSKEIKQEVDKWLKKLGLEKAGNTPCGVYSGGMKRRLSIGIAMIGDPPVVLLDEPTSGVDPVSRRQFWEVIASAKAFGQSVILTSHSMDEIEVLCSRLGIMVNGKLQCLGPVEYLRNKFAKGYTLILRLKGHHLHGASVVEQLKSEVMARFQPCVLQDEHQNIIQFQIMDSKIPWDVIFRNMEELKKVEIPSEKTLELVSSVNKRQSFVSKNFRHSVGWTDEGISNYVMTFGHLIEDYTVSLTSLEEVFLSFARKRTKEVKQ